VNQFTGDPTQPFLPIGEALMLAERYRSEGRLLEAEAICRRVLEAHPNAADAPHLLGLIAHQSGKLNEAIEHLKRAVKLAPRVALFHANLGEMMRLAGHPKEAAAEARRALAIDPEMPAALSNLGVALYELRQYDEAARAHRRAAAAQPGFAEAHSNLGNALHALKRFDGAIAAYRRAITLCPDYADAWSNLGTTLHHAGDFEEAMAALRRAIALAPGHADAHSGIGILLLMRGDLGEGWEEYDWRLRSSEVKGPRFPERPWEGETLAGRHIFVQAEQGFGDTLQFARYLPLLAARAGTVTVRVHQQLAALLRESLPGVEVLGERGAPSTYDCGAVLLSLPRRFKTRLETIPGYVPYLRVPAEAAARWKQRLDPLKGLKIGFVWAGNPEHANDMRRSLELHTLAPVLAVDGTSFVSLQVGGRAADLKKSRHRAAEIGGRIIDLSRELTDFVETAAAVMALDLVITVDTAVAHLAGGLGKPVWVLLPWVTDWRWMLNREDNPWYPTMRLFRQKRGETFAAAIAALATELHAVAAGDTRRLTPFRADGERRAAQAAAIMAAEAARAPAAPLPATTSSASPQTSDMPAGRALMLAEQKRRHGFLADADELCRRVLSAEPDNAEASHLLGLIAHQSGRLSEAIDHLRRAVALAPGQSLYHANLGEMCRLAGRTEEAIAAGRRALALTPDYPEALSNLGIALFEQDRFEEALALYERAVELKPDFVQAHSNRGNALQRLLRFAEAEPCYRRAIELEPTFPDAYNNLGTALRELKRPQEAESIYRKALVLRPNDPETLDNLALAVKDLERMDEAADLLRRALAIDARSDKIHLHYGTVLLDLGRVDEATAAAERALALNPRSHDAINLIGRVAFDRGDLDAALDHYRHALVLKPDLADAYNNIGNALKERGALDEARQAFLTAVELDPRSTGVYLNLADSMKFTPDDPHLAAMEALAAQTGGLSRTDRLQLDFALGKAYGDIKQHRRSFEHLLRGAAGKRAMIQYDEKSELALFDSIERTFSAELVAAKSGGGDPSHLPIFVLGMPRSGTTLVEQILASHRKVHGAGELNTFNDVVLTVAGLNGNPLAFPRFVPALDTTALHAIGARYVSLLRELSSSSEFVVDKMPSNYYFAGLIHLTLPSAKIIHTVRDPVDTCVSCFSKLFTTRQEHTYDLAELGRYYARYHRLMAHWRKVLPEGRMLDVRYEDVVADLEGAARRIIAHCGLPWDDRCLSFYETARPVRTASASQVRQPIYSSAVGRWRVYEEFLDPLLAGLRS
jgi:tetratricopeptide (TPR) repeat protein